MTLKPWMKVLCWVGLGGGIGFFGGYQIGAYMERKHWEEAKDRSFYTEECLPRNINDFSSEEEGWEDIPENETEKAVESLRRYYRGEDIDGDETIVGEVDLSDPTLEEKLAIDAEDISLDAPSLPYAITEEEFNQNEPGYELKNLEFYEYDEVLYDPETRETIPDMDALLGKDATFGFGGDPNNPVEWLYIQNDMKGTLYAVELVHGAFIDQTGDAMAPQEEPGEEAAEDMDEVYDADGRRIYGDSYGRTGEEEDEDETENW